MNIDMQSIIKSRGFDVSRFASKEEACDYLAGKLSGAVVGMGGSVTRAADGTVRRAGCQ
jgi:hypothetical protein